MKLAIIKKDELNKPIEIIEVVSVDSNYKLRQLVRECETNKKAYEDRIKLKENSELTYKQGISNSISSVEEEIRTLKQEIRVLKALITGEDSNETK